MYTWFHAQTGFHKPEIDADDDASEADAAVTDIISKADADDDGDTEDSTTTALIIIDQIEKVKQSTCLFWLSRSYF